MEQAYLRAGNKANWLQEKMTSVLQSLIVPSYTILIFVCCRGASTFSVSENPVYSGEPVALICSQTASNIERIESMGVTELLAVTLEADNDSQTVGTLVCNPSGGDSVGAGIFSGYVFTGCETVSIQNPTVSVSIVASSLWELNYRCLYKVFDPKTHFLISAATPHSRMTVFDKPEHPWITPSVLIFNDNTSVTVVCNSRFGKPAAEIDFAIMQRNGHGYAREYGTDYVTLKLSSPLGNWHGATATCRVTNHILLDAAVRTIHVNHIAALRGAPVVLDTCRSSQMLNCSAEISSVPAASYKWSIPADANVQELSSSLSSPVLTVPQSRSGTYHCVGTNKLTLNTVRITFAVVSCESLSIENNGSWTIVVAMCAAALAVMFVLVLLCKRGRSSDVTKSSLLPIHASQQEYKDYDNKGEKSCDKKSLISESREEASSRAKETYREKSSVEQSLTSRSHEEESSRVEEISYK